MFWPTMEAAPSIMAWLTTCIRLWSLAQMPVTATAMTPRLLIWALTKIMDRLMNIFLKVMGAPIRRITATWRFSSTKPLGLKSKPKELRFTNR